MSNLLSLWLPHPPFVLKHKQKTLLVTETFLPLTATCYRLSSSQKAPLVMNCHSNTRTEEERYMQRKVYRHRVREKHKQLQMRLKKERRMDPDGELLHI